MRLGAEEGTPTAGPKMESETGPGPVWVPANPSKLASNVDKILLFPFQVLGQKPPWAGSCPVFLSGSRALTTNPAIVNPTAPWASIPWPGLPGDDDGTDGAGQAWRTDPSPGPPNDRCQNLPSANHRLSTTSLPFRGGTGDGGPEVGRGLGCRCGAFGGICLSAGLMV